MSGPQVTLSHSEASVRCSPIQSPGIPRRRSAASSNAGPQAITDALRSTPNLAASSTPRLAATHEPASSPRVTIETWLTTPKDLAACLPVGIALGDILALVVELLAAA